MTRTPMLLLALSTTALAQAPPMSSSQVSKIDGGGVVVQEQKPTGGDGVAAWAAGVVNAPIAKVWPVVRDCAHFHKFMPRTKESKLLRSEGNEMDCKTVISMPFPLSNLWAHVRSTITEHPGGGFTRTWTLLKGNYKRNNGGWTALPWKGDPNRTLLVYRIDVDPDMFVPDAIIRSAQTGSLPKVFKAVRKRVGVK